MISGITPELPAYLAQLPDQLRLPVLVRAQLMVPTFKANTYGAAGNFSINMGKAEQ